MPIIKEGAHFKYEEDTPTMVIIQNEKMRVPVIYKLVQISADEIAGLIENTNKV